MVAADADALYEKFENAAKERQKRKPANSVRAGRPRQKVKPRRARDDAAKVTGASGRSVERAGLFFAP